MDDKTIIFKKMSLIRSFEEFLLYLFSEGKLNGTTHSCIGQELISVAVAGQLDSNDMVISNHRCHGHFIEKTGLVRELMAEIMGLSCGVSSGKGGSQHLRTHDFMSGGVQGNLFPVAAGLALGNRLKKSNGIVTIFIGDGTLGQGVVYEALNLIGLLKLPILVVVENNGYAQSTSVDQNFSGTLLDRLNGFGIRVSEQDLSSPCHTIDYFAQLIEKIRNTGQSHIEIINTYRLSAHSKGDDFRDRSEIEKYRKIDPYEVIKTKLGSIASEIELESQNKIKSIYDGLVSL